MATPTTTGRPTTSPSWLRVVGIGLLVLGLFGVGIWGVMSAFTSEYGTTAEGTVVAEVAEIGAEDPVNDPGVWTGMDESGTVIWVGTEEEWQELTAEARSAHQADLRNTWLYPSAAVALVGLLVVALGWRRSRTERSH